VTALKVLCVMGWQACRRSATALRRTTTSPCATRTSTRCARALIVWFPAAAGRQPHKGHLSAHCQHHCCISPSARCAGPGGAQETEELIADVLGVSRCAQPTVMSWQCRLGVSASHGSLRCCAYCEYGRWRCSGRRLLGRCWWAATAALPTRVAWCVGTRCRAH
jgi:hypothetical protein